MKKERQTDRKKEGRKGGRKKKEINKERKEREELTIHVPYSIV